MRILALLAAAAAAAALLGAGAAGAAEYDDVMGALLHMEAAPQDPAQFRFDLSAWQRIVEGDKEPRLEPRNAAVEGFLAKMQDLQHLRTRKADEKAAAKGKNKKGKSKGKNKKALQPEDGPPKKMLVVGAGPNGLVAALLGRYYGYAVEVLEMTDGRDTRWNKVIVSGDELRAFLSDVVGISSTTYYSVAEMQYVLSAAAQLAGASVVYKRQYVRHCPGGKVLYRPTPQNAADRRAQPDATVCGAPGQLLSVDDVDLLVGADGGHSFVRDAMDGNQLKLTRPPNKLKAMMRMVRVSNSLQPVTKFHSAFRRVTMKIGKKMRTTHEEEHARSQEFTLLPPGANTAVDPLLAMLIFEFRAPPAPVAGGETVEPVSRPRTAFASKALDQSGQAQQVFDAMFAANGRLDRDRAMSKLIYMADAKRVVRRQPTAADAATHEFQTYTYVDVVFRHRAGKALWAAFQTLTLDGKLAEVAKHARGEANTLDAADRALADRLLGVMHQTGDGYGVSLAHFKQQIGAIKLFGQQLRHAKEVHVRDKGGLEVVLVGDSSRDSYFPHGQSFSTAANAFVRFMRARADSGKKSLKPAAQLYKEQIIDFLDVTASSIYFEGFCGIAQLQTSGFNELSWGTVRALAPANEPFTLHLAAPPQGVQAAANGHYPAAKVLFGADDSPSSAQSMQWTSDTRYGSFQTGWNNFVQHVLGPRCEAW